MVSITEKKIQRFQFLKKLYDMVDGDPSPNINENTVGEALGWEMETTDRVSRYLIEERLVEQYSSGGEIQITHWGVKEVENAISKPEEPTQFFPPAITFIQGDQYTLSGNFHGVNLSIKSSLHNVSQIINTRPHLETDFKEELHQLLQNLNDTLQAAQSGNEEAAEAVALSAKDLVESAIEEKPNKIRLKITKDGLQKAASNIASVMPKVMVIANQIIELIDRLHN